MSFIDTEVVGSLEQLVVELEEARQRTLLLLSTVSDDDLARQHDPLMGPILWDLGHIAAFEELWLTRNLDGPITFGEMPGAFNPFEHPRRTRGRLALPPRARMLTEMRRVRELVLARIARLDMEHGSPLERDGYVVHMVAQHEYQHGETILQTLQLKQGEPYHPPARRVLPAPSSSPERGLMLRFPGGDVEVGTDDRIAAYDNERPRHVVHVDPFWIDAAPVTNGDYLAFMDDGGYHRPELWSDEGWTWLMEAAVRAPKYWSEGRDGWVTRSMDRTTPVPLDHPVCHVCWHEADAYARWAGKRLPTESEWETAASWDPRRTVKLRYPWGADDWRPDLANLDQLAFGTLPIWSYPANVSPLGCYGMVGDVWEWTASDFQPYPGFAPFPYVEYSQPFFGNEYKVLRGGSWASRPGAVRATFRNWDYPIRRQIFAGFRCARDG